MQSINSNQNTLASGHVIDRKGHTTPVTLSSSEPKSRNGYDAHYSTPVSGEITSDSTVSPSEHLYDLPLIRSSMDSPSPTEGLHLLPSLMNSGFRKNIDCSTPRMNHCSPNITVEKPERSTSPLSFVSDFQSGNQFVLCNYFIILCK